MNSPPNRVEPLHFGDFCLHFTSYFQNQKSFLNKFGIIWKGYQNAIILQSFKGIPLFKIEIQPFEGLRRRVEQEAAPQEAAPVYKVYGEMTLKAQFFLKR